MPEIVFKGGLLPNDPFKPRLRLTPHITAEAVPPASADYYSAVPQWGMLGNDQYGDCVFAENGHIAGQQTALGEGTEIIVTTQQVLDEYSRVTGFNPNDPNTDNGATVQDGLGDLRTNGIAGVQITTFAQLDTTNMTEVKTAVFNFGMVDVGCMIYQSDMDRFNAGQGWVGTGATGNPLGGHCIGLVGYDANNLYFVTWGKIQKATYAWWNSRVQEAWAIISSDWADEGNGKTPRV